MGKRRKIIVGTVVLAALLCACVLGIRAYRTRTADVPLSRKISNYEEVIASIRHGLRVHSSCITVRFSYSEDVLEELSQVVEDWVEEALRETGDPTEGDYIRYQYGGYSIDCRYDAEAEGLLRYTVEIVPRYYMYLIQEEEVTERLQEVYESFDFDETTPDIEKLRTIYGYVCGHVTYDQVHKRNSYFHMKSTAYAALVRQTATCQGYCVLLYRMLRDNGIGCRVITGTGYGEGCAEFHAWNLAELDGRWYGLDATWDAGAEEWRYFLKGMAEFTDHVPGGEFQSRAFAAAYPLAREDWNP